MFKFLRCLFIGKRILETGGYFIAQVYELRAGWCGIDKRFMTWATRENIMDKCLWKSFQEANDHLQNYLEFRKSLKELAKKKIHAVESTPKFWRVLRRKND